MKLTGTAVTEDEFEAVIDTAGQQQNVAPGSSGYVLVSFRPTIAQYYSASITVRTNDKPLNCVATGRGIGPKMVVHTDSLFLGYVYAGGDISSREVTVFNQGAAGYDLNVSDVTLSDPAYSVELPPDGLTIPASDSADIVVHFQPDTPDRDYPGTMVITGNYPATYTVVLNGRGMAEPGRYVYGEVSGVWDWSPGSQDYIILDSVYVAPMTRLHIEPGARVLFEPGAYMTAHGTLTATGLPEDPIHFLPRDTSGADEARWGGINLVYRDDTRMTYCEVRGSRYGVRIREASPTVSFCTLADNGDTSALGGGLNLENSGASITGCLIENNRARLGGGVYIVNSIPRITNCTIRDNSAAEGGGVYMRFLVGALLQSNLIYNNSGGAVAVTEYSSPRLVNNTIIDNTGGGLSIGVRSIPAIVNNIIWENGGASVDIQGSANALVSYSDVQGGFGGANNQDVPPEFDLGGELPYLLADSSEVLVDEGNPEPSHNDFFFPPSRRTERNDIGAYGGPLGGGWSSPDIEISVFQNPAFPHWLDIYVISQEELGSAPVCSLQVGSRTREPVPLAGLSSFIYRGDYEALESGVIFITVDADLSGGHFKIGRTYNLVLLNPNEEMSLQMVGLDGTLHLPRGPESAAVVTGVAQDVIKPDHSRLFLSPEVFIWGMSRSGETARLEIPFDPARWSRDDLKRLGIYRREGEVWVRLEGGWDSGVVSAPVDGDGSFALAWDAAFTGSNGAEHPESVEMLKAYPNPFNRLITIEYLLGETGMVSLGIYDLTGRRVAHLVEGLQSSGRHRAVWDGRDFNNLELPSGLYWARLQTGGEKRSVKLLLLR